jgi:outer membrane protein OmpA-like peptidoglycan-associated protein
MMDDSDDGARVGLWVTLGIITLLLFGLIGGLAIRQMNKAAPAAAPTAAADTAADQLRAASPDALIDGPIAGELIGSLYFNTGSAALPADANLAVAAAQASLAQAPATARLVLSGFHDASGDPAKNAELAKERAKAVRAALQAAGVEPMRIGLRKPESTTGDGKAEEARRVEIRLVQ